MTARGLDERFAEYHRGNPQVYEALVRFAREARAAGRTRCGIKMCVERLRWDTYVRAVDGEFKVNNLWAARYARLIEEREPDLRGFFTSRRDPVPSGHGTAFPSRPPRRDRFADLLID